MPIESIAAIVGAAVIVVSGALYVRSQRGGPGPEVGHVPGFLRGITNAWFGVMDWPIPFDRSGQLIPVEMRQRARQR